VFSDERDSFEEHACFIRATAYDRWCGNTLSDDASVHATFVPTGRTQSMVSGSCDEGWVLYSSDCYFNNAQKLNWSDASATCQSMGASLASIHSKGENEFLSFLTGGISSWIGVIDINKNPETPADHRWTDRSQMDYRNWNGSEPKQDPVSAWYTKPSNAPAPSVCKKPAKHRESRITSKEVEEELVTTQVQNPLPASNNDAEDTCANNQVDQMTIIKTLIHPIWSLIKPFV
jgi:hypothetical protein